MLKEPLKPQKRRQPKLRDSRLMQIRELLKQLRSNKMPTMLNKRKKKPKGKRIKRRN